MPDDRFDRDLARRLRAYESRIPDAEAPSPVDAGGRRPPWAWLMGVGALGIVAAGMLALVVSNTPRTQVGDSSPSPVPTASPAASASVRPSSSPPPASQPPSASAQAQPTGAPTDLAWADAGSFGADAGAAVVNDVVSHTDGLVAVGTQYDRPLPNLGPAPPRDGRIWTSGDGRAWTDRTPEETFADVELRHVYIAADGAFMAIGTRTVQMDDREVATNLAWESTDGVVWREVEIGLSGGSYVVRLEHGARGYLALVRPTGATHDSEIWLSSDGRNWELVRSLDGTFAIGAGDEGFVVTGTQGPLFEMGEPFTIASSDGREWFEAPTPPSGASAVLPLGGDWIVIAYEIGDGPVPEFASVWHSADGLDWSTHGDLPLDSVEIEGARCTEYPANPSAGGGWLIAGTTLSYPCSEGGFVVHGSQWISTDGASWSPLPLEPGTPGAQGSGSSVRSAAMIDGRVVLVGEANLKAAFWIGEAP